MLVSHLQIVESQEPERIRLRLSGELDLASAPRLRERLDELRQQRRPVVLDLSELEFMDSSGLHLMIDELQEARVGDWSLRIDPNIAPQVLRLFRLVELDRLILDGPRPGAG